MDTQDRLSKRRLDKDIYSPVATELPNSATLHHLGTSDLSSPHNESRKRITKFRNVTRFRNEKLKKHHTGAFTCLLDSYY